MARKLPTTSPLSQQYDVIVVGSGAGGLSTAVRAAYLGLSVLVLEKTEGLGGTTAWSGGWLWIPRNPLATEAGIYEDVEAPRRYVCSEMHADTLDVRADAFLQTGPDMVEFFATHTALRFIDGNLVPDFHQSAGHAQGGRSVAAAPFDGRQLGPWKHHVRPPLSVISLWGMGIASGADIRHFFNATRRVSSFLYVIKRLTRHLMDKVRFGRSTQLVNGNALVGALLKSALDLDVRLQTNAAVTALTHDDCGRVSGVEVKIDGIEYSLSARQGVVMAAGGFPHDKQRQAEQFTGNAAFGHFSAAPKDNTGDGITMAQRVGARIRNDLANAGAWSPVSLVPHGKEPIHFPHLIERAKPGIIAVLPNGKRFTSEADSYHDFMRALFDASPKDRQPYCWLVADHKAQRRWGLGWSKPFPFPTSYFERTGYLKKGRTLAELASTLSLPVGVLTETVVRFNQDAKDGIDRQFQRGASPYNRIQGDPEQTPNPSLAALEQGPFYAVKIVPGSLGTFSGIDTNEHGQACRTDQSVIEGLYAVGNDMSSIFGGHYPSGGITLGPAMTFGYRVANHLAQGDRVSVSAETTQKKENTDEIL
ncbi:FAD-dependent oxidoreductase [Marinomonas sp. IMCC 4694]|uniref:FAD-dependent oxidoreductase n=1 Tax=Marinomonas sp. IMCC 4694 TaxID=2605432 RepID=UPI0011E767C7|nr:FAD-dependent oxidoreductase [Marinomonas sp. IMCC 4694]TYL48836.1 FAD-dependent oxidoreductase [Marinomonas sp. IMCC 4694]